MKLKPAYFGFRTTKELKAVLKKEAKRLKMTMGDLAHERLSESLLKPSEKIEDYELTDKYSSRGENAEIIESQVDILGREKPLPNESQESKIKRVFAYKELLEKAKVEIKLPNELDKKVDVAALVAAHKPKRKKPLITNFGQTKKL